MQKSESQQLSMTPSSLAIDASEWQKFLTFMVQNYSNSELNLKSAAKQLGCSESSLSRLISNTRQKGSGG